MTFHKLSLKRKGLLQEKWRAEEEEDEHASGATITDDYK